VHALGCFRLVLVLSSKIENAIFSEPKYVISKGLTGMKKVILSIALIFMSTHEALALDFMSDRHAQDMLVQVAHETLNSEYEKGIYHAQELTDRYPREPLPRFILASIYMYMLRSYWDFPLDERYDALKARFREAAAAARKACDEYPVQDAMVYFVRGMVLGTEALVHLQNGEWLESYSKGKRGVTALEKSLEMDPGNYDAYLGLGIFEYYCSKLTGVVKILAWIVGFQGDSEKGMAYVTKAMNYGRYAEGPAKVFLAHAFIEYENKLDQGIELTRSLRSTYPKNYLFVEYVVRAVKKLPPEKADEGLEWIHTIIKTSKWKDDLILFVPYNLDMVDYVEACLHLSKQDYAAARDLLEPVSARSRFANEFIMDVNLALLSIYTKTKNHEQAERMYSLIMRNMPINNSHAKAREIIRS
jgi:tetratricopeptide (TPR) repeat protein